MADTQQIEELKIEEIKKLLENGDFEKFKSKQEGDFFEAKKSHPYDLDAEDPTLAIASLISDVAALANSNGGYIVCGLITKRQQDQQSDVVKDLDLVTRANFYDQSRVQGIIKKSIYPKVDVEIDWYASEGTEETGVGSIFVPPQEENKKYFIVRVAEIQGNILKKNYIGIPIRKGANITWLPIDEVYRLTKRAPTDLQQLHNSLSEQISEVKELVLSHESGKSPADDLSRKIEEVLDVH